MNAQCTGLSVSAQLVLTASHCVGLVGDAVTLVWMKNRSLTRVGRVVHDVPRTDYACVRLFYPVPRWYWITGTRQASQGEKLWGYTASLGLLGWEAEAWVEGIFDQVRASGPRRVMVLRAVAYPGASGAIFWDASGGPQMMLTHGLLEQTPPLVMGPTADQLTCGAEVIGR